MATEIQLGQGVDISRLGSLSPLPSLKLTVRTWKYWFPIGISFSRGLFSGANWLVSFREGYLRRVCVFFFLVPDLPGGWFCFFFALHEFGEISPCRYQCPWSTCQCGRGPRCHAVGEPNALRLRFSCSGGRVARVLERSSEGFLGEWGTVDGWNPKQPPGMYETLKIMG